MTRQATCNADHSATVTACNAGKLVTVPVPVSMNGTPCTLFNDIIQIFPTSATVAVKVNC